MFRCCDVFSARPMSGVLLICDSPLVQSAAGDLGRAATVGLAIFGSLRTSTASVEGGFFPLHWHT